MDLIKMKQNKFLLFWTFCYFGFCSSGIQPYFSKKKARQKKMLIAIATIALLVASQFHTSAGGVCFGFENPLMCPVVPYPNNIFTGNLEDEAYNAVKYTQVERCDGEEDVASKVLHNNQKKGYLYKTPNEVLKTMTEDSWVKSELGDACRSRDDGYSKVIWSKNRIALYLPPLEMFVMNVIVDLPLDVLVQRFYNITVTKGTTPSSFYKSLKTLTLGVIDFDSTKASIQIVVKKANDKCIKPLSFANIANSAEGFIFTEVEEYFAGNKEFFAYVRGAIRAYGTDGQMKWELK